MLSSILRANKVPKQSTARRGSSSFAWRASSRSRWPWASASRRAWRPVKGSPCEGRTSRLSGRPFSFAIEASHSPSGSASGSLRPTRDVGGDPRQHLVAGDHQPAFVVDQAGMFGAMAVADQHPPVAARRSAAGRLPAIRTKLTGIGLTIEAKRPQPFAASASIRASSQPAARQKASASRAAAIAHVARQHPAEQPFAAGHPQRHAEALGQPAGEAEMVGMEMGADHPGDRRGRRAGRRTGPPRPRGRAGCRGRCRPARRPPRPRAPRR